MEDVTKTPRIYITQDLSEGIGIEIADDTHHYLKNVMRVIAGDALRLFNGRNGEYAGRIDSVGKKSLHLTIEGRLRAQENSPRKVHLFFAPLKKEPMDWMIEKAVELGATDLHPVLTQNTDMRKIKDDRLHAQIVQAAEQCERMDIPTLHPMEDMLPALLPQSFPIYAALERIEAAPLWTQQDHTECAILIGPAGGFSVDERERLSSLKNITPVSLGRNILRAETAAVAALSLLILRG